jgi:hypothetical protein
VIVPLALVVGKMQVAKAVAQRIDKTKNFCAARFSEPGVTDTITTDKKF